MERLKLISVKSLPIYEQLLLEERLLRTTTDNWCIFNEEASPAIVVGISGVPEELIDFDKAARHNIPVIRRFTGGGTVVVDSNTCFVTMICNSAQTGVEPFPERVHAWAEKVYREAFQNKNFSLRENDYVFDDRKFGGNAQYMQRGRWLHHSSFLWDYNPMLMDCLLLPKKRPQYRQERSHESFLTKMCVQIPSKAYFFDSVKNTLARSFQVEEVTFDQVNSCGENSHRIATKRLLLRG